MERKIILAFVGMPGAGKSEAAQYLKNKNVPFIRFGQFTDEGVKELGLPLTPDNEKMVREKFREKFGMAAYAIKAMPRIHEVLATSNIVALDGLYSWEEYVLLKKEFPTLILIQIYAEPNIRYKRLAERQVRPIPLEKSRERDIAELEKLNKGGPIAIADFCVVNNDRFEDMYKSIDHILQKLKVNL